MAASDRVIGCHVRRQGHLEQLLHRRLQETTGSSSDVVIVNSAQLVSPSVTEAMQALGATLMDLGVQPVDTPAPDWQTALSFSSEDGDVLSCNDICPTDYLTHCTRRQSGPWPDQSERDYLDDLILDRPESNHSPLAVLKRITDQQRLIATGKTIRGGTEVVCFTAVALNELAHLRTFRPHRGRWDFEPYGISISRRWLQQHHTRPVTYGDSLSWDQLPEQERPYFQSRFSGRRGQIDWSVEREWRHVGDIDLKRLPADAALLFVPNREEALWLGAFSRWPVLVVE